jgi:protein phosphatase-4 regulatory subunit 3
MVAAKDDFYNRHIMKFNLFDPIVQLFVANGKKYNLINSAVIELFDYIRKVGLRLLTPWPVKQYGCISHCVASALVRALRRTSRRCSST